MVATKNYLNLFSVLLLLSFSAKAQNCSNCNATPSIAQYDLDVQVEQPQLNGSDSTGWLEWLQLFWLAKHANGYLYKNSKDCIRFVMGPDQDANEGGMQDNLKIGATYTQLPHKSFNRGYLTTGYVKQTGSGYIMHLELQSSCSRKTVAFADIPFSLNTILENSSTLGHQAASHLMPLIDKIKQFELKERNENKTFALGGFERELIKITPAKKILAAGQQTEIYVSLKDCDGVALAGREIVFTEGEVGGMPITGTYGGAVTPSRVVTDAQGKAKAIFKMTAAPGKPAIINAHTLTSTQNNCADAFIGSAKIDVLPGYKVTVNYQKISDGTFQMKAKDSIFSMTLADEEFQSSVYASSTFYYYSKPGEKEIHIEGENPPSQLVFSDLRGYSNYQKIMKAPEIAVIPLASSHKEGNDSVDNVFSSELLKPDISFSFKGEDLYDFDIDFNFHEDESGRSPDGGGVLIIRGDKDATFTKRKITDPSSPYKTEHIIRYSKKTTESNKLGGSQESIFQEIIILSTF